MAKVSKYFGVLNQDGLMQLHGDLSSAVEAHGPGVTVNAVTVKLLGLVTVTPIIAKRKSVKRAKPAKVAKPTKGDAKKEAKPEAKNAAGF